MLKTSSLGLKAHGAADIPGLFCCCRAGASSKEAADKQEHRPGAVVLPQRNCLDKWLEKFSGWKDATVGSAQDTLSQGGNFCGA